MKKPEQSAIPIGLFLKALEKAKVPFTATPPRESIEIEGHRLALKTRSLPSSTERILEPIAVHALRQRLPAAQETVLIIGIPRIPFGWQEMVKELTAILDLTRKSKRKTPSEMHPIRWAICSDLGGFILHGIPGCAFHSSDDLPGTSSAQLAGATFLDTRQRKVNDLMFCILKLLLVSDSSNASEWFGEKNLVLDSTRELTQRFGVSSSAAFSAMKELRSREWITNNRSSSFRIDNHIIVMKWWLNYAKTNRPKRFALRTLYPSATKAIEPQWELDWLRSRPKLQDQFWAINGWRSCEFHNKSFITDVRSKKTTIAYKGSMAHLLNAWELALCPNPNDDKAIIFVDVVQNQSTFFGQMIINDLPCVDLWQVALDICGDPDHGAEQAMAIVDDLYPGNFHDLT